MSQVSLKIIYQTIIRAESNWLYIGSIVFLVELFSYAKHFWTFIRPFQTKIIKEFLKAILNTFH